MTKLVFLKKKTDLNGGKNLYLCIICQSGYFLNVNFNYKPKAYQDCHDLFIKSLKFNYVTVISVNHINYRIQLLLKKKL